MSDREDPLGEEGLTAAAADVRTVAKGGAVQIAGQVSQRGVSFFFTAVAVRILEAGGYGLYRQVAQILSIAGQLGLCGFNYAAMRYITRARAHDDAGGVRAAARTGVLGALSASALTLVVLVVAAEPLGGVLADTPADVEVIAGLLRIGAAYVPLFALMQVLRYCTQAYRTMIPSVIAGNIVQPVARFVLGIGALLAGFAVAGAVTSLTLSVAIGALAAGAYLRRMLPPAPAEERTRPVGPMVRFALPQAGASLLGIQTLGLGVIVLGVLSTDVQVGLFGVALSLQGPGNVFLGGIVNIWAPVVSDLHERGEIRRLGALYQTINRWIATFSFPVFVALILEGDLFVRLFAGPEGRGAADIVAVLAVGNFFYTGTGPTGYVLSMTGRPGVNFANSVVAVALYVLLGMWLVPRYGALGMAVVDAFVTALVNTARVVEAKVLVGVQPFGRTFVKPVVASLAGAVVLLGWRVLPWDGTPVELAGLAVAAAAYLATLAVLGVDAEERMVLERIRRRGLRRRNVRRGPADEGR